jgi:NhaP-type Na+/H+ or K+/H+ antiporter
MDRALLLRLLITVGAVTLAGNALLGLNRIDACLVGAILSPIDPAFVAALPKRKTFPFDFVGCSAERVQ